MSLLHLENNSASLNRVKSVSASDQKLHCGFFEVVFVNMLTVDAHDVLISLHLTELAHKHMERVLCFDVDLTQIVN